MTIGFFHVFPPCMYMSSSFNLDDYHFFFLCYVLFFLLVRCVEGQTTRMGLSNALACDSLDDFSVSRTSRPASHRLLESNSTLGANPWLTPFARCHESRPKNNSYNKKDCGVVVVVVVVAPSRNGRHPFDFHLGNCRRCWIASEEKSLGGRPSNKNLFFFFPSSFNAVSCLVYSSCLLGLFLWGAIEKLFEFGRHLGPTQAAINQVQMLFQSC
jgi:hypothetical protein